MPTFAWEGRTKTGQSRQGVLEAPNEGVAMAQLRSMEIIPLKVSEARAAFEIPGLNALKSFFKGKVAAKDLMIFTRQFATMINAGLPLVQCLDILGRQQESERFKSVITEVKASVEGGATFADSLKKHPDVFDELYTNLVAAGEVGGILDTILNRLVTYIEKAENIKKKVKGALTYPIIVLCIAGAVVTVLLIFVIPTFEKMFRDFGGALPGPTQFVIDMSHSLQRNFFKIVIGIVVFIAGFRSFTGNPRGREIWDNFMLKAPLFGNLIRKVAVARFTRVLSTMISSGVPILDGLEICARTAGNMTIEKALQTAKKSIGEGKTIAEPLQESGVFPGMVCQMIAVGEQAGALDAMLNKIADFYDEEVDAAVEQLTGAMEPVMMVFLGVVVGGFLIAMYLPIFSIAGAIH